MNTIQISLAAVLVITLGLFSWKKPRLSSIIVWALVATVLLTSAALLLIPGDFSAKAIWLSLSVPIIWTAFQYWCYWADNQWKVLWTLVVISLMSGAVLLSLEPVA